MKKNFSLLLIIIILSSAAKAQDTVRYGDPWYQFHPLPNLNSSFLDPAFFNFYYCQHFSEKHYLGYENEHNPIYGIAIVMDSLPGPEWNYLVTLLRGISYQRIDLHTCCPPNINIDSFYVEDTVKSWENPLIKRCQYEYCFNNNTRTVRNCFEFYFDTPILKMEDLNSFADTFFVGISYCVPDASQMSNLPFFLPNVGIGADDSVITTMMRLVWSADGNLSAYYQAPGMFYNIPGGGYDSYYRNIWGGIFPIIGRRCSVPRGLTLATDSSSVHWRSDTDAELFQLSLCTNTEDPDAGLLFTTTATTQALPSFHPDSTYRLYLRKQCSFRQDTVWSDWSAPLVIAARQPVAGIDTVAILNSHFSISPNPSDGVFTVHHTATEGTLTVTDLQGREIQTIKQLHNQTITLDLSRQPQGTYLVTLTTPAGPTTKKLLIQ